MPINAPLIQNEREGLLAFLEHQRQAVRLATFGLHDDQARLTPSTSGLSLVAWSSTTERYVAL
jgi:hypothetical protein